MNPTAKRLSPVVLGPLLAALFLVILAPLVPIEGHFVVDNGSRWLQAESIRSHGSLRSDIPWPGEALSPDRSLVPGMAFQTFQQDGRIYTQYPPAFAFLLAGLTSLVGPWGYRIPAILGGVLLVWGMILWGKRLGLRHPVLAGLLTLLLTPLVAYSQILWDVLTCIGLSVLATYLMTDRRPARIVAGGALAGLAFVLREEYSMWTMAMVLTLALLRQYRSAFLTCVGFGILALPTLIINTVTIGKPLYMLLWSTLDLPDLRWSLGSRGMVAYLCLARFGPIPPGTLQMILDCTVGLVVLGGVWLVARSRGSAKMWIGLGALALGAAYARYLFWGFDQPHVVQHNGTSAMTLLPVLFLGLIPLARMEDEPADGEPQWERFLRSSALIFVLLFLLLSPPISARGFHFGPRLMLPALPPLALLAWRTMETLLNREPNLKFVWLAAALVALMDSTFSMHRLIIKAQLNRDFGRTVLAESDQKTPILIHRGWIAMDSPILWRERLTLGMDRGRERAAIAAARQVSPQALVLGMPELPPVVIQNAAKIERVNLYPRVIFPDRSFLVAVHRVTWKQDSTTTMSLSNSVTSTTVTTTSP